MNRAIRAGLGLCLCMCIVGCAPERVGVASVDELGQRVFAALVAGDVAPLEPVSWTASDYARRCVEAGFERRVKRIESLSKRDGKRPRNIERCQPKLDWSKARLVSVSGAEPEYPEKGCPGVVRGDDLVLIAAVDGRDVKVRVSSTVRVDERLYISGYIWCDEVGVPSATNPLPDEDAEPE